jgi:hypothetical protein
MDQAADTPASLAQLRVWAADPDASFSPLADRPFLLLDASSAALPTGELERLAQWLHALPCPCLGVAAAGTDNALTRACDVQLASVAGAATLAANIRRNPLTAAVLVQTLRATAELPVAAALDVESLAYATLQGGIEFQRWLRDHQAAMPAVPTDSGPAVIVERDGDALTLELNRASNRNALNVEMRDALVEALQLVLADDTVRTVLLRGRGKCFSVGGDLTEFGTLPDPATAHAIRQVTMPGRFLAQCGERVECRVHGACIGSGVELPAFCRRVTAAPDTFFHMPELRYGLLPGGGGCVSIPRRIGRQRTAWWVLSGKRISARTALEWGLVDEIK